MGRRILVAVWLALAPTIHAADLTWTGTANGDWFVAGNWSGSGSYPQAGDAVSITNGSVLLTNTTAALASFTITNSLLTCSNWNTALQAADVTIRNNGTLALPPAFTNNAMSNRIWIVCGSLTLHSGGALLADAGGYARQNGPGCGVNSGGNGGGSGGGYGGRGGSGNNAGGIPYGSTNGPTAPGSGGGAGGSGTGGHGGGAIRVEATGTVLIHGSVSANGTGGSSGTYGGGGGGSGGSIWIDCVSFGGTNGTLRANGGNGGTNVGSYAAGGGGGGRIAVAYTSLIGVPSVRYSANRGSGTYALDRSVPSDCTASQEGTLSFTDTTLLDSSLSGWSGIESGLYGLVCFESTELWAPASFQTVSDSTLGIPPGAVWRFGDDVTLTTGGSLLVSAHAALTCDGDLTLTNGAKLTAHGGATNNIYTNSYGALISVAGALQIASDCWIYPYSESTNGGSVLLQVGRLEIQSGGGIDADGRGYARRSGPGKGSSQVAGNAGGGGGGYGGKGGTGTNAIAGGNPYGLTNAPIDPGSGGGNGASGAGGHGGGLVRIESAGHATINGTVSVNGGNGGSGPWGGGGGGSGGAIHIVCASLRGASGILQVKGGTGGASANNWIGGGGGGGRIAIWGGVPEEQRQNYLAGIDTNKVICTSSNELFLGSAIVTNGTGAYGYPDARSAYPGTAFFFAMRRSMGTVIFIQ